MNLLQIAKRLEGLQTASSISKMMGISRRTAVNYVSLLRKKGLVETIRGARKIRRYKISTVQKKEGGIDFYEILNKYSKIKLAAPYPYRIHKKKVSVEEVLIRAIETERFRVILASLGLFAHVKNWPALGRLAKEKGIGRKIGALYDVARTIFKARRMDLRTRNSLLNSALKNKYIIKGLKSRDFKDIENRWGVCIPFNKADLEVYEE